MKNLTTRLAGKYLALLGVLLITAACSDSGGSGWSDCAEVSLWSLRPNQLECAIVV